MNEIESEKKMEKTDFISGAQIISSFFENIENQKLESTSKILVAWKKTVQKISGNGAQLFDHSRIVDLKNGILLVETDHPAWSQMLQFHKKFILTGLNKICADDTNKIESLVFRVRGSNATLADAGKKIAAAEMKKYSEKLNAEEKILFKKGIFGKEKESVNENKNDEELPDNLKEIFTRMKSTALKNNEQLK